MNKLTPEQLRAKYGMGNPPEPNNPHVVSLMDGPRIVSESYWWPAGRDLGELFDPSRCPEMYGVARRAHAELRSAMAAGEVEYLDPSGDAYDPDDVDDTATLVHFVGWPGVVVVRSDMVELFAATFRATWLVSVRQANPERCQVKIAPVCDLACANGRAVDFIPYVAGQIVLMFPACGACRNKAIETAGINMQFSQIAAIEQLDEQRTPSWGRVAPKWLLWWVAVLRLLQRKR